MNLKRACAALATWLILLPCTVWAISDSYIVAGGLIPPLQYPSAKQNVYGLRISPGWAENAGMYGLDLGLVGNMTDTNFVGGALAGGFNSTSGNAIIVLFQAAGIANSNFGAAKVFGVQFAFGYNYNAGKAIVVGAQASLIGNFASQSTIYGVQCGFINKAERVNGIQIGIVNRTKYLTGLQIGLMNFVDSGWIAFFPVLNVSI